MMKAYEVMRTPAIKVKDTDDVRAVIEKFIEHDISGLPIVNDRNEVVAYISDGDIMRVIGKHKDLVFDTFYYVDIIRGDDDEFEERVRKILDVNVMDIAKLNVYKVSANESLENIAALLGKRQIKKLPVVRNGVLVGVISRGDVIRASFKSLL